MRIGLILCVFHLSILAAQAQYVDVHEEPFHRPVLEHGAFRYLHVEAGMGDTTAMHVHRHPILYVNTVQSQVWLEEPEKPSRESSLPEGWIGSNWYEADSVFIHRFAVLGNSPLMLTAVEYIRNADEPQIAACTEPVYHSHGFVVCSLSVEEYLDYCHNGSYPAIVYSENALYTRGRVVTCTEVKNQRTDGHNNAVLLLVQPQ